MKRLIYLLLTLSLVMGCKKEAAVTPAPQAAFNFAVRDKGNVLFTNVSENANDYVWTIDNGLTTTAKNWEIDFAFNGTYKVTLVAKGPGGQSTVVRTVAVTNL